MRAPEPPVIFVCDDGEDGCGATFIAKANYAGKIKRGLHRQLCRRCARDALRKKPKEPPTEVDLIFWFERFSDDEIALFGWAFFGASYGAEGVLHARAVLAEQLQSASLAATG